MQRYNFLLKIIDSAGKDARKYYKRKARFLLQFAKNNCYNCGSVVFGKQKNKLFVPGVWLFLFFCSFVYIFCRLHGVGNSGKNYLCIF